MMLLCIWSKASIIEIPMNYRARVGSSMVTGNRWVAFLLGLRMIQLISQFRLRTMFGSGPNIDSKGYSARRASKRESATIPLSGD